jgi:hypothetical protein
VEEFGNPGWAAGNRTEYDGIYVKIADSATFINCKSLESERDGIETQAVHTLLVDSCILSNNGRLGAVSEEDVSNAHRTGPYTAIYKNIVAVGNGSGGMDAETYEDRNDPNYQPVHGLFYNNWVENGGFDCFDDYGWGIVLGYNSYGEISNNTVINYGPCGSVFGDAIATGQNNGDVIINNNTVVGASGAGIMHNDDLATAHSVSVNDNDITAARNSGINLGGAGAGWTSTVLGNVSHDNTGYGISVSSLPNSTIANNVLFSNSVGNLLVTGSAGSTTTPNTFMIGSITRAPKIRKIWSTPTTTGVTVTWVTDVPATSEVTVQTR